MIIVDSKAAAIPMELCGLVLLGCWGESLLAFNRYVHLFRYAWECLVLPRLPCAKYHSGTP